MIDTPGHLRCSVTELSDASVKGMGEIKTDQTGIQTLAPCISSQLLYELRYLAPVFKPVYNHAYITILPTYLNDLHPRRSPQALPLAGIHLSVQGGW